MSPTRWVGDSQHDFECSTQVKMVRTCMRCILVETQVSLSLPGGSQQQSAQNLQNVASKSRQSRPRYKPSSARLPSRFWTLGSAPLEMKYSAISVYLISYDVTCTPIFCCSLNGPEHDNVRSGAFYTRPNFVDLRKIHDSQFKSFIYISETAHSMTWLLM